MYIERLIQENREFCSGSFSNKGTQTLIGNLVSAGTAGDLSRFTAPKSNALLADQNWELRNAKKVGPINRLREMLWDFTYLCWKMTEYSFAGIDKPIGISTYKLTRALPSRLKSVLPTVEEIEQELSRTVKAVGSRAASPKGKAARKKKRAPRAR